MHGRLIEYFINYMSKEWPLVAQHRESIDANGNRVIENTYIIYTPKIIKFVYHTPTQHTPLAAANTLPATLCLASSKESKTQKTKINLVSRGTTQITDPNKS
jgi:hypothetical protein